MDILNYIKINELIATSGQPTPEEFKEIKDYDYEVVINLALHDSSNAIKDEDKIVTSLGMSYFHIPVDFENPSIYDLKLFINILQSLGSSKVWIHCALNYRVSAFMYVYHKYVLNTPFENLDLTIFEQWQPELVWQDLMKVTSEELYNVS